MKQTTKLLCLVLVLCVSLGFAACKKDAAAQTPALPTDTASIYYLSGVSYGEHVYTTDQLLISDPTECYIFFDLDGYGVLCIDTFETYFQYAGGQLWEELDPETKTNYMVQGDSLTLEKDGYKMVFTKGELPEWALPDGTVDEVPEDVVDEVPEDVVEDVTEETPAQTAEAAAD